MAITTRPVGKYVMAAYEGGTIDYRTCGKNREHALGALWLRIWQDRHNIDRESLVLWLGDIYEAIERKGKEPA